MASIHVYCENCGELHEAHILTRDSMTCPHCGLITEYEYGG